MIDDFDSVFAARLEKWILHELDGDAQNDGLLRMILASQDWETFVRTKGIIYAYDEVLKKMANLAREMNEPEKRRSA